MFGTVHMCHPVIQPPVSQFDWIILFLEYLHVVAMREVVGQNVGIALVASGPRHANVLWTAIPKFRDEVFGEGSHEL